MTVPKDLVTHQSDQKVASAALQKAINTILGEMFPNHSIKFQINQLGAEILEPTDRKAVQLSLSYIIQITEKEILKN